MARSFHVAAVIGLWGALGCARDRPPARTRASEAQSPAASKRRIPPQGLARACAMEERVGDVWWAFRGLTRSSTGQLYLVDEDGAIRRYAAHASADACDLTLDTSYGAAGRLPGVAMSAQEVHRRYLANEGNLDRTLVADGDAVYFASARGPLHRVDRGVDEVVCPAIVGLESVAATSRGLFAARHEGGVAIDTATCVATEVAIPSGGATLYGAGDTLYAWVGSEMLRLGHHGELRERIDVRIDLATDSGVVDKDVPLAGTVVACGDDLCMLDGNLDLLVRLRADGTLAARLDDRALLGTPADGGQRGRFRGIAGGPDGFWLLVTMQRGGSSLADAFVYYVPYGALH